MTPIEKVDTFKRLHPIGTRVIYWPLMRDDGTLDRKNGRRTVTRSEPMVSAAGYPVIFLSGIAGYVCLAHVEVDRHLPLRGSLFDSRFAHEWGREQKG